MQTNKEKLTSEDVLGLARVELNMYLDKIKIAPDRSEISTDCCKFDKVISETLLTTCPHCNNYHSLEFNNEEKRIVIVKIPTYSKESFRTYHLHLIMCPKCRKDYVTISFKDNRFTFNDKEIVENNSYKHGIAWNSGAIQYTINELKESEGWEFIKDKVSL